VCWIKLASVGFRMQLNPSIWSYLMFAHRWSNYCWPCHSIRLMKC